jgi:phosphoribosylanthranilate isomerase
MSEKHERFIKNDKVNGITGWLSGIKVVAESYFGEKAEVLAQSANGISAEVLEIDALMYKANPIVGFNLILRLTVAEWGTFKSILPENSLLHLMLEKTDLESVTVINEICASQSTLLNVSKLDLALVDTLLLKVSPFGLSIDGGNEISPGISDFDHLAEVLEYLEV